MNLRGFEPSTGRDWEWGVGAAIEGALPHAAEEEEIEEVEYAEDDENGAEFVAEEFDEGTAGLNLEFGAEGGDDPTEVEEVEADDEEVVVDGVGEGVVAVEGVDEEGSAVAVEGTGDQDGE